MRRLAEILIAFVLLFTLAACQRNEPDPAFSSGESMCLTVKGKTMITYNPETFQSSCRTDRSIFRVFSDTNDQAYRVECSSAPSSVGTTLKADVSYRCADGSSASVSSADFQVIRMDDATGAIWLWCARERIGVTVFDRI